MKADLENPGTGSRDGKRVPAIYKWLTFGLIPVVILLLVLTIYFGVRDGDEKEVIVEKPVDVIVEKPLQHPMKGDGQTSGLHPAYDPFAAATRMLELNPEVEEIFEKLSFEHRLGQLIQFPWPGATTGPGGSSDVDELIKLLKAGRMGSILNVVGAETTNLLQSTAKDVNGVPLLLGLDIIHGHRSIGPLNIGLAASFDPQMVEDFTREVPATEATADGIRWTFTPMLDVSRDPRWGRMSESSGEDPFMNAEFGAATVRGFQQHKPPIVACAKHLFAYGITTAGKDYTAGEASWQTLWNNYLEPFEAAFKAGVWTAMASFNTVGGYPSHGSREIHTDIARGLLGFKGFTVGDYRGVHELKVHHVAETDLEAAMRSLFAGVDMDMVDRMYETLADHRETKLFDNHTIEEYVGLSARRILWVKQQAGLFEDYGMLEETDPEKLYGTVWVNPAQLQATRVAAQKSAVLLKNADATLPRPFGFVGGEDTTKPKTLIVGRLANDIQATIGSWSAAGAVSPRMAAYVVPILRGVNERWSCGLNDTIPTTPNCPFQFLRGYEGQLNPSALDEAEVVKVETAIRENDFREVVVVVGEGADQNGEGASRAHLELPYFQTEMVRRIKAAAAAKANPPKLIMVLMVGRPNIITWELENYDALLVLWSPGTQGGHALWDLLTGDVAPSGRLPFTWPRSLGQVPIVYSDLTSGRPLDPKDDKLPYIGGEDVEFKYVSRYIDELNRPLFPFGFGLGYEQYTTSLVTVSPLSVSHEDRQAKINVDFTVTRPTSPKLGATVIQVYVQQHFGPAAPSKKRLRAFKRVEFAAGSASASGRLTLELEKDFGVYDAQIVKRVDPGKYSIFVAQASDDESHRVDITLN